MTMDEELRRALRRAEPSPGFTKRTMARIASEGQRETRGGGRSWRPSVTRWLGAAVAASIVIASGAGWYQVSQRAADAERARHDVELALRITTEKLQEVQTRIQAKAVAFRERQF